MKNAVVLQLIETEPIHSAVNIMIGKIEKCWMPGKRMSWLQNILQSLGIATTVELF